MRYKLAFACAIYVTAVLVLFNLYSYEISNFNDRVRVFLIHGAGDVRQFNEDGLPISTSVRVGEFVSPFYVVHYGLLYSESLSPNFEGFHWRQDSSMDYWNVQPPELSERTKTRYFRNMADWIVENAQSFNGQYHLIYNFDWPYRHYPSGGLNAPWWSGLTDGYAILLLLRAYDYFQDERYLEMASNFYASVNATIQEGGSQNILNGRKWIEEYVDPVAPIEDMPFVLNGMVYSTYGVDAYERYISLPTEARMADEYYNSIVDNIFLFDAGGWSYYDIYERAARIKYHLVHVALLEDLKHIKPSLFLDLEVSSSWQKGRQFPLVFYFVYGQKTTAYFHFYTLLFSLLIAPFLLRYFYRKLV